MKFQLFDEEINFPVFAEVGNVLWKLKLLHGRLSPSFHPHSLSLSLSLSFTTISRVVNFHCSHAWICALSRWWFYNADSNRRFLSLSLPLRSTFPHLFYSIFTNCWEKSVFIKKNSFIVLGVCWRKFLFVICFKWNFNRLCVAEKFSWLIVIILGRSNRLLRVSIKRVSAVNCLRNEKA